MDQQLVHFQSQLSRLSDNFVALHNAVTNTAGTPDAIGNALVRLEFLDELINPLSALAHTTEGRASRYDRDIASMSQRIESDHVLVVRNMEDIKIGLPTTQRRCKPG